MLIPYMFVNSFSMLHILIWSGLEFQKINPTDTQQHLTLILTLSFSKIEFPLNLDLLSPFWNSFWTTSGSWPSLHIIWIMLLSTKYVNFSIFCIVYLLSWFWCCEGRECHEAMSTLPEIKPRTHSCWHLRLCGILQSCSPTGSPWYFIHMYLS